MTPWARDRALAILLILGPASPARAEEAAPSPTLRDSIDRHVAEVVEAEPQQLVSEASAACPTVCEAGCRGAPYPLHREPKLGAWQARIAGSALGLALGTAWGSAAGSDDDTPVLGSWRGADYAALGVGLAAWVGPKLFDKQSPELGRGRFPDCKDEQDRLWSVDRRVRHFLAGRSSLTQRERAARWSDATLAAAVLQPLGMALAGAPPHRERDVLVTLGTLGVSIAVNDAVKNIFDRPRPYTHFCEPAHPGDLCARDAQYSFYSGHTSTSFAAAVVAGRLAGMHGYRNRAGIWATGLTLATATGVLRIKADKHYLTDVVVGAVAGSLAGWFLPQLHEPRPDLHTQQSVGPPSPASLISVAVPGQSANTGVVVQAGFGDGPTIVLTWRF